MSIKEDTIFLRVDSQLSWAAVAPAYTGGEDRLLSPTMTRIRDLHSHKTQEDEDA